MKLPWAISHLCPLYTYFLGVPLVVLQLIISMSDSISIVYLELIACGFL